jgi:hypothetical protein
MTSTLLLLFVVWNSDFLFQRQEIREEVVGILWFNFVGVVR